MMVGNLLDSAMEGFADKVLRDYGKYKTPIKASAYWLTLAGLCQVSVSYPLATWAAVAGGCAIASPFYRNLKAHAVRCAHLFQSRENLVVPVALTAAKVLACTYVCFYFPGLSEEVLLACTALYLPLNIAYSTRLLDAEKEEKRAHRNRKELLTERNQKLQAMISRFDQFVKDRPELLKLFTQYGLNDTHAIAKAPALPPELNPKDPLDNELILELTGDNLEFVFNERVLFLKRHSELYEVFTEEMKKKPLPLINDLY